MVSADCLHVPRVQELGLLVYLVAGQDAMDTEPTGTANRYSRYLRPVGTSRWGSILAPDMLVEVLGFLDTCIAAQLCRYSAPSSSKLAINGLPFLSWKHLRPNAHRRMTHAGPSVSCHFTSHRMPSCCRWHRMENDNVSHCRYLCSSGRYEMDLTTYLERKGSKQCATLIPDL